MTIAVPSLRAVVCAPGWVRNDLWRRARAVPSLDLQFADRKSLVDAVSGQNLVTFTRASGGTYVDSAGVLQTAGTNEPRFDHNPTTGECLGLLVEEQRTNSIRNNTMVGAVAGTPGTLPTNWTRSGVGSITEIVGTGTENGITYIDIRFTGTVTNTNVNFEASIAAAPSQTWTASSYIRLLTGTITGAWRLSVNEFGSGGVFLRTGLAKNISPTSAALSTQRPSGAFTTGASTETLSVLLNGLGSGQTVDFTLRIGLPQLEQGGGATTGSATTGSATTRNAELADIVSQALAAGIRTLYAEFRSPASGTRGVVSLNDNTANERAAVNTSGTDPRLVVVDGGATQADIDAGTIAANARSRMAVRIAADNFAASFNGGAVVTDTSGTLPTVDRLFIGRTQAGEYLNAPIARLIGWRDALPDSVLQELTR